MEVQYFSRALGPCLRQPHNQLLEQAKAALLRRIDELAEGDGSAAEVSKLNTWCETIQGGRMSGRAEMVTGFRVGDLLEATRFNVASFKA